VDNQKPGCITGKENSKDMNVDVGVATQMSRDGERWRWWMIVQSRRQHTWRRQTS